MKPLEFLFLPKVTSPAIQGIITIDEVINAIQTGQYGNYDIKGIVSEIRHIIAGYNSYMEIPEDVMERLKKLKMKLPACKVSVSSIKKEGRKSELEYTGYSQHDFDIKDNPSLTDPMFLKMMKEQLFEEQRVRVVAESPSGGLKVIFYNGTPIDEKHHKQLFAVGKTTLEKATGLVGDDISAATQSMYITFDQTLRYKVDFDEDNFGDLLAELPVDVEPVTPASTPQTPALVMPDMEVLASVESCVQQIEERKIDISGTYKDWTSLAFSLCSLGEAGRDFFNRVSRFYPEYDPEKCTKKFDQCLAAYNGSVTLGSFFHLCKGSGITYRKPQPQHLQTQESVSSVNVLKALNDEISQPFLLRGSSYIFPAPLAKFISLANTDRQRDIAMLGFVTALSGVPRNVQVVHADMIQESNLQTVIAAPPGNGKGILERLNKIFSLIDMQLYKEYIEALDEWEHADEKGRGPRPPYKTLFISADSSMAALTEGISALDGYGILFEAEVKNLANTAKNNWGAGLTTLICKDFHNEQHKVLRKGKDPQIIEPKFATLFSGVPETCFQIFNNRDGLSSRQTFYVTDNSATFNTDIFSYANVGQHESLMREISDDMLGYYHATKNAPKLVFAWKAAHQAKLGNRLKRLFDNSKTQFGGQMISVFGRMSLSITRFMANLFALELYERMESGYSQTGDFTFFEDKHLHFALDLAKRLFPHSLTAYTNQERPVFTLDKSHSKMYYLLTQLPDEFKIGDITNEVLKSANIGSRDTFERYVKKLITAGYLVSVKHGHYSKRKGDQ